MALHTFLCAIGKISWGSYSAPPSQPDPSRVNGSHPHFLWIIFYPLPFGAPAITYRMIHNPPRRYYHSNCLPLWKFRNLIKQSRNQSIKLYLSVHYYYPYSCNASNVGKNRLVLFASDGINNTQYKSASFPYI